MQGKIPPQAIDLEEAVLGAVLIDSNAMIKIGDKIHSEMFYKHEHIMIWEAIINLHEKGSAIDLLTVSNQLRKDGNLEKVGGDYYITNLATKVSSTVNIEFYSLVIKEQYVKRRLIEKSQILIERSYKDDEDVFELIEYDYDSINEISTSVNTKAVVTFSNAVDKSIQRARDIADGNIEPGLPTPIKKITKQTGGWMKSDLIILAGRPGMGKTALGLAIARVVAKQGSSVGFFSLEMSTQQLTNRIISQETKIELELLTRKGITVEHLKEKGPMIDSVKEFPIHIDDTTDLSIQDLSFRAKKMHADHGIKLLVVDYLQLMTSKAGNREQEISKISRGLKRIAKELDIPVIALSQLSRAVETRGGNKRPMLSDLRDSGAIEQDADVVIFLYRPEYYKLEHWDDDESTPCKGQVEINYAKFRNGDPNSYRAKFIGKYTLIDELDTEFTSPKPITSNLPTGDPNQVFGGKDEKFPF